MDLRAEATLVGPRDAVYRINRDRLAELVPYLPNVRRIDVKSREPIPGKPKLVNEWHGGGDVPAAVRAVLSDSVLSWTDYAEWDDATFSVGWRSESHSFPAAVDSRGRNEFVALGPNLSAIRIQGRIVVDATKIPGVPRLLAGRVGKLIEAFLARQVQNNLEEIAKGVERFLREHPEAAAP